MIKSVTSFFESNDVTININNLKEEILSLNRCKRKDKIKTRSISIEKLIKLLKCYKKEHKEEREEKQK